MTKQITPAIRPAVVEDLGGVLALFEQVAAERIWIGTEPGFDRDLYLRTWLERMAVGPGALIVAAEGEAVVGVIDLREGAHGAWDLGMLVAQNRRGQGIGAALLHAAIDCARDCGIPALTLGVFAHNSVALRLYEKSGFVPTGQIEPHRRRQSGEIWDTIMMERRLDESERSISRE